MTNDSELRLARLRRALPIVRGALEVVEARRAAWLDAQCAGDPALHAEVCELLAADHSPLHDIERLHESEARPIDDPLPGRTIGNYRIAERIGEGGMGTVYRAEPVAGVTRQPVALKLIKRGMDSEQILRRFLREREILARLDHPHIARLLDGGMSGDGQPWFAMEHVDGEPLLAWCDRRRLDVQQRITLFLSICDAVAYAHGNLVVHRDLKPGNVLVTGDGVVKLLDFGIAKLLDAPEDSATATQALMTPDYAAPEQFTGGAITTQTDVYQLGRMLWELLSGRRFTLVPSRDADDSAPAHADSTTRRDSEVDPQQATQIAAARQSSVPALARALRGDLERIVRRCLSPQPERRYAGAAQLADDLRRYLRGDPVSATDDSWAYRLGKFVRRQRLAVGAVVSVVLALAIGLGLALHEARALRRAEARIETALGLLEGVFLGADPYSAKGGDTRATDLLASAHARVSSELGDEPALAARLLGRIGAVYVSLDDRRNAEATLREAVQAGTRAGLAARIDTAAARARLAHYALVQDGDATKLAELESAIAELRAAGPAGRPSLAQALSFKSDHLFNTGQYETIPALAAECVVLARESNGPLAADYIMALGNQASLLRAIGRENDAVAPAREAWQQVQALGKEAPAAVALYAEGQYAGALAATGDAASAAPLLRDALAQAEKINGADSSFAIGLLWELSSAQATLGQNELAAAGFSRLLGYMGDVRTANRIAVQNALGSALLALGRAAEAAPQFADAETIACASTADSPSCVAIRLNVAEAQLALQHTQEAGRMLDAIAPLIAADNERARARWQKLDARRQGH